MTDYIYGWVGQNESTGNTMLGGYDAYTDTLILCDGKVYTGYIDPNQNNFIGSKNNAPDNYNLLGGMNNDKVYV